MHKTVLLIFNPVAGTQKANKYLAEIITMLSESGYKCMVQATTPSLSAEEIAEQYAQEVDLMVCIGGDGTLNSTIAGCLNIADITPPMGYIPAGSTNDFANGLHFSTNPLKCAANILQGDIHSFDVGTFNGRPFVYTASFGAFTRVSYATPREVKNNLGYFAYILESVRELVDIKPYHMRFVTTDCTYEGDYVFGAICNSKRLGGGVIRFNDEQAELDDGLLEVLLVKFPTNPSDLVQALADLSSGNFQSPFLEFFSTSSVQIHTSDVVDWTIDGEYQESQSLINIAVLPGALQLQY